jgi:NAD(P)-dependent dehydrogenase (short-subunit alcohol dehydrogenase family)
MGCRNPTKGAQALLELRSRKPAGTLSLLTLDVTSNESISAAVEKITKDFGAVDILVNNAGIVVMQPKDRRSELLETFNTNAASALVLTEALIPLLQKSKDPRIINVSSGLGSISNRGDPNGDSYELPAEAYRMSKAALNMATVCMYASYKSWGAKAWAFCPGFVITNLTGEGDRQRRVDMGADSAETSAQGILEIAEGKRDDEVGLFVKRKGERWDW